MHDETSRDADAEGDGWRDGCGGVPSRPICVVSARGLLHIVLHMYVARCGPRRGPARQTSFSTHHLRWVHVRLIATRAQRSCPETAKSSVQLLFQPNFNALLKLFRDARMPD